MPPRVRQARSCAGGRRHREKTEYGRALDDADRGDLENASKRLAILVKQEPEFKLAQNKSEEVPKALMEAKKRRAGMLDEHERQLLERIDTWLASHDPTSKGRDAEFTFDYRIVRGELFIAKIKKLAPGGLIGQVPEARHREYLDLVAKFSANTSALQAELGARQALGLEAPTFHGLPDEDRVAASKLIGGIPGQWPFLNQQQVHRDLAAFLALGEYPGSAMGQVRPPPASLDKRLYNISLRHCDQAIAWIETYEGDYRARESMMARKLKARILVAMGQKIRAMAELQSGLDAYPDSEEFEGLERMLTSLLQNP